MDDSKKALRPMLVDNPVALRGTKLFKPIKVGGLVLNHRLVMAPLTRLRAPNGIPHEDWMTTYYDQRSKRTGSLIITEGSVPQPQFGGLDNAPGLWSPEQRRAWTKVIRRIHGNGSYVFIQLWSMGSQADPLILAKDGLPYVSATDETYVSEELKEKALKAGNPQHGLTQREIQEYVSGFVEASQRCIEMGADGVEIHAANGYLLNQFLDPSSNKRVDTYGGSIENRSRFLLQVVDAVVDRVGSSKVGIRISPFCNFGSMSELDIPTLSSQYTHLLGQLEERARSGRRLAYVHIVDPHQRNLNDFVYTVWKGIVIRAGGLATRPQVGVKLVENDRTILSYGRYFTSNPDLVDRIENGWPFTPYDPDTFTSGGSGGYIDYPPWELQKTLI
ncbi:ZYRO0C11924p [Zygosaccharomyces rouxii]|uniref:ZYRO0C11924p n=2 Tax=Zygosaccharomyces rouxii TaxID=4956 RepID=C5DTW9_ZYGRC|nr:uncharacterized protein ZYRO0C11924g [Zygosaccharomyces rouxii]KAH9201595.1 NADPH dehydrogenase 2 [Zygosaccharomyces rouxii]CAQ43530.1 NADPH dehydrogenase 2 [Zygosaccharomyces rouxii]CAR27230.1 ZYRO0C11924p [Zygosaccharomyces rouxii]